MITTKSWGETLCALRDDYFEVHIAKIKKGGHCSLHKHRKENQFLVMNGLLRVELFDKDKKVVERHDLGPWGVLSVAGGMWHKFTALEDTDIVELYRSPLDANDIERDAIDIGGLHDNVGRLKQP